MISPEEYAMIAFVVILFAWLVTRIELSYQRGRTKRLVDDDD